MKAQRLRFCYRITPEASDLGQRDLRAIGRAIHQNATREGDEKIALSALA